MSVLRQADAVFVKNQLLSEAGSDPYACSGCSAARTDGARRGSERSAKDRRTVRNDPAAEKDHRDDDDRRAGRRRRRLCRGRAACLQCLQQGGICSRSDACADGNADGNADAGTDAGTDTGTDGRTAGRTDGGTAGRIAGRVTGRVTDTDAADNETSDTDTETDADTDTETDADIDAGTDGGTDTDAAFDHAGTDNKADVDDIILTGIKCKTAALTAIQL